jgi:hypothetical protein
MFRSFSQIAIFAWVAIASGRLQGDEADRHLAIFSPFTQRPRRVKKQDVISLEMEWAAC